MSFDVWSFVGETKLFYDFFFFFKFFWFSDFLVFGGIFFWCLNFPQATTVGKVYRSSDIISRERKKRMVTSRRRHLKRINLSARPLNFWPRATSLPSDGTWLKAKPSGAASFRVWPNSIFPSLRSELASKIHLLPNKSTAPPSRRFHHRFDFSIIVIPVQSLRPPWTNPPKVVTLSVETTLSLGFLSILRSDTGLLVINK